MLQGVGIIKTVCILLHQVVQLFKQTGFIANDVPNNQP